MKPTRVFLSVQPVRPSRATSDPRVTRYRASWVTRATSTEMYKSTIVDSQQKAVQLARSWLTRRNQESLGGSTGQAADRHDGSARELRLLPRKKVPGATGRRDRGRPREGSPMRGCTRQGYTTWSRTARMRRQNATRTSRPIRGPDGRGLMGAASREACTTALRRLPTGPASRSGGTSRAA